MKKIICTTFSSYNISALVEELQKKIKGIEFVSFLDLEKKTPIPNENPGSFGKDFFSVFFDVEDIELTANIMKDNQDIDMDDFQDKLNQNIEERKFLENNCGLIVDVSSSLEDIVKKIKDNI